MSAESLEEQFDGRVTELALLDSMYPDQLECDDDVITNYIKSENFSVVFGKPITGSFVVDKSLTVCFVLSQSYPEISKAQIHCRVVDGSFEKSLQKTINDDVNKYIENDGTSLMDILQYIIQHWENIDKNVFLANKSTSKIKSTDDSNGEQSLKFIDCVSKVIKFLLKDLSRFWIYSHHIYSSTKRKSILELSQSLKLKGFILIGKPGMSQRFKFFLYSCDNN